MKKNNFLILFSILLFFTKITKLANVNINGTELNSFNNNRFYILHIPSTYRSFQSEPINLPLYIFLHGGGGKAWGSLYSGFLPISEKRGFIAVFPEGFCSGNHVDCTWHTGSFVRSKLDDVKFLDDLIMYIKERTRFEDINVYVDEKKIYMLGMSNGGFMTYTYASNGSVELNTIVPIAASIGGYTSNVDGNNPYMPPQPKLISENRKVNVLHCHGKLDMNVKYDGGITGAINGRYDVSVNRSLSYWLDVNECVPNTVEESNPEIEKDMNGNLVYIKFSQCKSHYVRILRIEDAAHSDLDDVYLSHLEEKSGFADDTIYESNTWFDLIWNLAQDELNDDDNKNGLRRKIIIGVTVSIASSVVLLILIFIILLFCCYTIKCIKNKKGNGREMKTLL